jgi:hypothetical protein
MSDGARKVKVAYDELSEEDLVWLYKKYPHTEQPITSVMQERIPKLARDGKLEQIGQLRKDLPFLKAFIDSTLVEQLKDNALPKINEIATKFVDLRESILQVIAARLKNPTDEFLAIGKFPGFGNHNEFVEKKIAAYEEIATKYPELKKNVADAIRVELADPTKDRFWEDLKLLNNLIRSFPETKDEAGKAVLRSIRNPDTLEKNQHLVYYDSFGVRFSQQEVVQHPDGWFTIRGHHPVTPKEEASIGVFNQARMGVIRRQWPNFARPLEDAITEELKNTARRWSWNELRELAKSFPGIQKEAEAVVARDLSSPKPQFEDINLEQIVRAFPDLKDVVAKRIESDFADSQKKYAPEALIEMAKRYPHVADAAEARLRNQMETPKYNRDFENLERLDEIVQAFPKLKDCARIVLGRMIENPMRPGDANKKGKLDLDLAKEIALRFDGMLAEVEAVFKKTLENTLVQWEPKELAELVTILPNLEPAIAKTLARDLKNPAKNYTLDELLKQAKQFPSIKDHCADLVLEHVRNPSTQLDIKKLMEIAWRFPSLTKDLEPYVDRAVDRLVDSRYNYEHGYYLAYSGRMIEFLSSLIKDYSGQKDLIMNVIYRRIERIVEHSDKTSLEEWYLNNKPAYNERVAKALATKGVKMEKPEETEPKTPEPEQEPVAKREPLDTALAPSGPVTVSRTAPAEAKIDQEEMAKDVPQDTRSNTGGSEMSWQENAWHILRTWWREIGVGVLVIPVVLYVRSLYRRFKRWRNHVWEERDSRRARGESSLWDKVMYLVWRRKPASVPPEHTEE